MITTALLVYVCTTAAMDDCEVYAPAMWDGPAAIAECQEQAAELRAQVGDRDRFPFVRFVCELSGGDA